MRRDYSDMVARARRGESEAWAELVQHLKGVVWSSLAEFDLGEEDRKDVFASAFCRLVEHLDSVRDPERLPGWMATTTRNEARMLLRSRSHIELREDPLDVRADTPIGDEHLLDDELRTALRSAFSRLTSACQELLRLASAQPPIPYDDIALMLGIPRGSVGPTRQRCLDRLRQTPELRVFLEGSRP